MVSESIFAYRLYVLPLPGCNPHQILRKSASSAVKHLVHSRRLQLPTTNPLSLPCFTSEGGQRDVADEMAGNDGFGNRLATEVRARTARMKLGMQ